MPTVRVTVPKNDLTEDQRSRLVAHVTEEIGRFFEAENKGDLRDYVIVHVNETAGGGYGVGGAVIG